MSFLKLAVNAADHYQGNRNAKTVLVEYGDFECSHCKRAHAFIQQLLKEKKDDLCFIFRNFPLRESHRHAFLTAIAAEAAAKQGKFWEMHDAIFENQRKLNADYLFVLAAQIGLDLRQLSKDSTSNEVINKVETDFESGVRSGVNGTPCFFLNGHLLSAYNETYESLLNAIEHETEKQRPKDSARDLFL